MSNDTPSLLGPATEQDMTRWQLKGAKVLVELLTHAFHEKLPSLDWRLGTGSSLYGTVQQPTFDSKEKRSAFDRWTSYLDAVRWPEHAGPGGRARLRAKIDDYHGVHITIAADLYDGE
ncbi:hypothetical protein ACFVXG_20350 [Kitasatospora sp. NPDC058162]|uniref:hypothetical protein n=1 Tax=Kitasatospora sp. NPDC058162 TaxID=3346362 RepID=UPI0036DE74E8